MESMEVASAASRTGRIPINPFSSRCHNSCSTNFTLHSPTTLFSNIQSFHAEQIKNQLLILLAFYVYYPAKTNRKLNKLRKLNEHVRRAQFFDVLKRGNHINDPNSNFLSHKNFLNCDFLRKQSREKNL